MWSGASIGPSPECPRAGHAGAATFRASNWAVTTRCSSAAPVQQADDRTGCFAASSQLRAPVLPAPQSALCAARFRPPKRLADGCPQTGRRPLCQYGLPVPGKPRSFPETVNFLQKPDVPLVAISPATPLLQSEAAHTQDGLIHLPSVHSPQRWISMRRSIRSVLRQEHTLWFEDRTSCKTMLQASRNRCRDNQPPRANSLFEGQEPARKIPWIAFVPRGPAGFKERLVEGFNCLCLEVCNGKSSKHGRTG